MAAERTFAAFLLAMCVPAVVYCGGHVASLCALVGTLFFGAAFLARPAACWAARPSRRVPRDPSGRVDAWGLKARARRGVRARRHPRAPRDAAKCVRGSCDIPSHACCVALVGPPAESQRRTTQQSVLDRRGGRLIVARTPGRPCTALRTCAPSARLRRRRRSLPCARHSLHAGRRARQKPLTLMIASFPPCPRPPPPPPLHAPQRAADSLCRRGPPLLYQVRLLQRRHVRVAELYVRPRLAAGLCDGERCRASVRAFFHATSERLSVRSSTS